MSRRERYPLFQRGLGGFSSTAQFMQADNYIQSPEDFISYNRYSYCLYNPFKYTDPSGEDLKDWGTPSCQRGKLIFPTLVGVEYTSAFDSTPIEYTSNPYFFADYDSPVILWGSSRGTSSGIGFNGNGSSGVSSGTPTQHPLSPLELQNLYFEKVNKELDEKRTWKRNVSNPSTQGKNFMGTNYIGWMDAKNYDETQDFLISPVNMADYYARIHDLEYTNIGYWTQKRTGRLGFLVDTRTIAADYKFTRDELKVALSIKKVPINVRFTAAASAYVIGGCMIPKTLLQMMKPNSIIEIMMYNNIGKTRIPKKRKK